MIKKIQFVVCFALTLGFTSIASLAEPGKEIWTASQILFKSDKEGSFSQATLQGFTGSGVPFEGVAQVRLNQLKKVDADARSTRGQVRFMVEVDEPELGWVMLCGKASFTGGVSKVKDAFLAQGELSVITVEI